MLAVCDALLSEGEALRRDLEDAEGSVILDAEDAPRWEAFRSIGVEPDDVRTGLAELGPLRRSGAIADAAEAGGYRVGPLAKLIPADAVLSVRVTKGENGRSVRTPEITPGGGEPMPLSEWLADGYADFLPALRQEPVRGVRHEFQGEDPRGTPTRSVYGGGRMPRPGESPKEDDADPMRDLMTLDVYGMM